MIPIRENNPNFLQEVFSYFSPYYISRIKKTKNEFSVQPYQNLFSELFKVYPKFLLMSEPGTGKTITFLDAIEKVRYSSGTTNQAVILENNNTLVNTVINEIYKSLLKPFPEYSYIEDYKTEKAKRKAIKKVIKNFYTITTYTKFYNKNKDKTFIELLQEYFNTIFVCDEFHHFLGNENFEKKEELIFLYKLPINRLILVTATPLTYSIEQLSPYIKLLNLNTSLPNPFSGYVSYVPSQENTSIKINYVCNRKDSEYKLYYSKLKGIQLSTFKHVFQTDSSKNFYRTSVNAASFVFPDGSYGGVVSSNSKDVSQYGYSYEVTSDSKESGISKYVEDVSKKYEIPGSYELKSTFKKSEHPDLGELSAKFDSILNIELSQNKIPGTTFIYTGGLKNGGGAIILSLMLEKYGNFVNYRKSKILSPKTYVYINTEMSDNEKNSILQIFNSPDNASGNKIKLIIGTEQLKEGISFSHVTRIHLLNRPWTYAEDYQSMGRGIRFGSHSHLLNYYRDKLKMNNKVINVDIYKHAAYYCEKSSNQYISVDLIIEDKMQTRQKKIQKKIEELKEGAIDKLFFKKNKSIPASQPKQASQLPLQSIPQTYYIKQSFYRTLENISFPYKTLLLHQYNTLLENGKEKNSDYINSSKNYIVNTFLRDNSIDVYGDFTQRFNNRNRLLRIKENNDKYFNFIFLNELYKRKYTSKLWTIDNTIEESLKVIPKKKIDTYNVNKIIDDYYNKTKQKLFGVYIKSKNDFKIVDKTLKSNNKGKNMYSFEKKELLKFYNFLNNKKETNPASKDFYFEELLKLFKKKKILIEI